MIKYIHEIRDPIHVFIRLTTDERKVLDSRPFQRLRQIHQLAMTYLVYPGATHRRFEHSLGVMELADRVYNVVTNSNNIEHESVRNILPKDTLQHEYWRLILKIAALCHDLGHLPFSHAAEEELLPSGWDHERITAEIIRSNEMQQIWNQIQPTPKPDDIIKIALGPKKAKELTFTDWETILSEIIVGDTFGVDRMDYLLRDSLHIGVAYGKFDHYRLIDTLRILPKSEDENASTEPTLGLTSGGIQSAEALLWARYFMYSQVYFHSIRRIYDIHLQNFLQNWLKDGKFSTDIEDLLKITDNEVIVEIRKAALDPNHPAHIHAKRITEHKHFKVLYRRNPIDQGRNSDSVKSVYKAACKKYGNDLVRIDEYIQKGGSQVFPVLQDENILQSIDLSDTLKNVPIVATGFVFIDREHLGTAKKWLEKEHDKIIEPTGENN
jgi:HD superfamily phosphohydrolase